MHPSGIRVSDCDRAKQIFERYSGEIIKIRDITSRSEIKLPPGGHFTKT